MAAHQSTHKDARAAKKARGEAVGNASSLRPFSGARAVQTAQFAIELRPHHRRLSIARQTQREMVEAMN